MAKQNRYYLLMAMLVSGATIGYEAGAYCLGVGAGNFSEGDLATIYYSGGGSGTTSYHAGFIKCVPYPEDCTNSDSEECEVEKPSWEASHTCDDYDASGFDERWVIYKGDSVRFAGENSHKGYVCGSDGFVRCPDVTAFNGHFYSCCGYSQTSTQASCVHYYEAGCNTGFYGDYTGKPGDCYSCSKVNKFNGSFNCCGTQSTTSTKVTCSEGYSSAKCDAGYYGTYTGASTDCTKCVTGPDAEDSDGAAVTIEGQSVAGTNTVITQCFVPTGDSAGSFTYVDGTGNYVFSTNCYYSK